MKLARLLSCIPLLISPVHAVAKEIYISLVPLTVDAHDKDAPLPELMQGILLSCLSDEPSVAVIEGAGIGDAASQTNMANPGFVSGQSGAAHYKVVDYSMTGSASSLEGKWLVSLQVNNPSTTQVLTSKSIIVEHEYNTQKFCTSVVQPLLQKFLRAKPADITGAATEEPEASAEATLMMRGISESKNGNYAKAFPYFLKVLANDSSHADARYWLAVSYAKAGLIDFAREEAKICFERFPAHAKCDELEALIQKTNKTGE